MAADMTMCPGGSCPLRDRCYRFRGVVHGRFDAFGAPPFDAAAGTCAHFADIEIRRPTAADIGRKAYDLWVGAGRPVGTADADWDAAEKALNTDFEAELQPIAR